MKRQEGFSLKKMNTGLLKQTRSNLVAGSAINPITVKVESQNQGGFHTKVLARDHVIVSDQPFGFDGENKGPKPSELVLAALAACQETTWRIYAEDMGIEITNISVKLEGIQDLRGFMSVDKSIPAGFKSIKGEVHLSSPANLNKLKKLKAIVDKHCPVLDDLIRNVQVDFDIKKI